MRNNRALFAQKYQAGLLRYLRNSSGLSSARLLGSEAVAARMEMLDVVRIHDQVVIEESLASIPGAARDQLAKKAGVFFAKVVLPIEKTHRSAREAARHLRELAQTLRKRTTELTTSKRNLKREISHRAKIEAALQKTERHYRQLLKESGLLQEQLRYLSHRILSTQEEERKRISRELHDQIASTLNGINVSLALLKTETAGKDRSIALKIDKTQQLIQRSVEVIHEFARDLRPTTLDDLGLIPALNSFAKAISAKSGLRIRMRISASVEKLEIQRRTVLYRVSQEALTNAASHANASEVDLNIRNGPDAVTLSIQDNGQSFDVERILRNPKNRRLGLIGMRERVEMVGGTFAIKSARGQGTTVHVRIPIRQKKKSPVHSKP